MITKFNYINVGSPSGVFNRIAYDCIGLAKEYRCDIVWHYQGTKLIIDSKDNLMSITIRYLGNFGTKEAAN